jgi:hypothetical protein
MRAFVGEIRARIAPLLQAGGLEAGGEEIAFLHTVVVGCAVLQLARDNAAARKEAREVLEFAVGCLAKKGRR